MIDLEEDRNRNEKRNTWLDRNNCRGGFAGIFDKSLFAGECICANRLYGKYDYGGDRNLALRTSYWFSDPQRGDVVVFEAPDDPDTLYVKRVIGVGGDTVEVKDGDVLVNGQVQDEPYIKEITEGDFGPYHVPEGCYFMMGDNRNDSLDARFWENTYVEKDAILGKVVLRYYKGFKIID